MHNIGIRTHPRFRTENGLEQNEVRNVSIINDNKLSAMNFHLYMLDQEQGDLEPI
jgi:hypothetical protein